MPRIRHRIERHSLWRYPQYGWTMDPSEANWGTPPLKCLGRKGADTFKENTQ